jgi:hypothetical protein
MTYDQTQKNNQVPMLKEWSLVIPWFLEFCHWELPRFEVGRSPFDVQWTPGLPDRRKNHTVIPF